MNSEKTKNILFIVLSIVGIVLSYALVSYVNTYSKSIKPGTNRSFNVSAEGRVIAIPDVAQFNFSIISEGPDLLKIQKENSEQTNKAIDFLKKKGVDPKDIKTKSYRVEPKYTYYDCRLPSKTDQPIPCPPPQITSYNVTQTIEVKIRDFSKIGDILGGIVEFGVNDVSGLYFTIDDRTKLEDKAREEAILKAKQKAQKIAEAGGFILGDLLSIEEGYSYYPYMDYTLTAVQLGRGGAEDFKKTTPSIEPGSQEIKVNVTLRYEIK